MADTDRRFELEIVTPEGVKAHVSCDSARITLADDKKGRGGGSVGIRSGHADAVFLLGEGNTVALDRGKEILSVKTGGGFATMENNVLSVVVSSAEM